MPARDEEELLPDCLESLIRAKKQLPTATTCEIVVAVDSLTDGSLEICRNLLTGHGKAIVINEGCVGQARAAAAGAALASFNDHLAKCWLANTDAGCVVPEDWLMRQLHHAHNGFHAVAGIISVDDFTEHSPHVQSRFLEIYVFDPHGSHRHIHGANMGVRADAYRRAGGWANLASSEDHALWSQLESTDAKTCADSQLVVVTTGRRAARAPSGFAQELATHNTA